MRIPGPRWLYVACLAFLAFLIYVETRGADSGPRPGGSHPELADVDAFLLHRLRELWEEDSLIPDGREWGPKFRSTCRAAGPEAARAIFKIYLEKYENGANGFDMYGPPAKDNEQLYAATMLGELADDDLRALLVRALEDRDDHPKFRRALAVALCRPQHAAALPALLARALDRQETKRLRRDILLRLHRIGGEPPARLRELLAHPFANLDFVAAGTLGRWGDASGVALIRDGLVFMLNDDTLARHLAMAANELAGTNHPFPDGIAARNSRSKRYQTLRAKRVEPHLKALNRELNVPATRALAHTSFEEILAAGEEFDIAVASMLAANYKPGWIAVEVERLDRLAARLRVQLEGVRGAEERIAILNRELLVRHVSVDSFAHRSARVSFLPVLLEQDYGNCLGYSTLYVALGSRLGLPLHAVSSPDHCFVRYDDGVVRRNIETTDLGAPHADDDYFGDRERAIAPGVFLANLTNRRLLSLVLSNYAFSKSYHGDYEGALLAAERALKLDPRNPGAHVHLAVAMFHTDLESRERVIASLEESSRLYPGTTGAQLLAGRVLLEHGAARRAIAYLERAKALGDRRSAEAWIARARARMGESEAALKSLEAPLMESPTHPALRLAELECRTRLEPELAAQHVATANTHIKAQLVVGVTAAQVLLDLERPHEAMVRLDAVKKLATRRLWGGKEVFKYGALPRLETRIESRQDYYLIRARAHHALGLESKAHADLEAAVELAPPNRAVLLVRDLLAQ